MLTEAGLYKDLAVTLLQGGKIRQNDAPPELLSLLQNMHAGLFVLPEPQTFVPLIKDTAIDPKFLGQTHIHPLTTALMKEADLLTSVCQQKGRDVSDFEVLGLNWDKRQMWRENPDFEIEPNKIGVLLPGDVNSLWQIASLVEQRARNTNVHYTTPIIIQNSGHFWDPLLGTGFASWKKTRKELERLNIFVSAGAPETADLLADLAHGRKISPDQIRHPLSSAKSTTREHEVLFTGDKIKLSHTIAGQKTRYQGDTVRMGMDVIGPFPPSDEQTFSLEGNADDKMRKVYEQHAELVRAHGRKHVVDLYAAADMKNLDEIRIVTNDGGWGATLENKRGDRKIALFPERLFPNTVHKLNPVQMGPGVEYAYMKRTDGLEYMMTNMEVRVAEIVDRSGSGFKRSHLTVYDSSIYMSISLRRMLDAIDAGEEYDSAKLGAVSVASAQKLGVAESPFKGPYTGVVDTIDYFIPKEPHGNLRVRAEIPEWWLKGPNVEAHRLGKMVRNVEVRAGDTEFEATARKHRGTIKMGMLGSLDALTQRHASPALNDVKGILLHNFNISTRQGPDYWSAYRNRPELVMRQAGSETNTAYMAGTRLMLDASSVFFAGTTVRGHTLTDKQKLLQLMPVIKGIVRNQVYNHTDIVIDVDSPVGKMALDLVRRKQELGLIQQRTEHLAHFVEGTQAAAEKISEIVQGDRVTVPPIKRQFYSDGQEELNKCMTAVVYCSATNCNKSLLEQYDRLGYLFAMNGFSLKIGGGNDGLMKAVADGFNKGKRELKDKGYDFPNQLILIQCVDTESIEKRYEGEGIYRCHAAIEPRKADLQQADIHINGAGGAGSDEEYMADMISRLEGLIDPKAAPMIWFNNQMQTTKGPIGVHDFYKAHFDADFLESLNANTWTLTAEETVAQACAYRASQQPYHVISMTELRSSLKDEHAAAVMAHASKTFRPPYDTYLGVPDNLPPNPGPLQTAGRVVQMLKHS